VSTSHRTESLDYGIVMKGPIILELDDGVRKGLPDWRYHHSTRNCGCMDYETDEWAQRYFILLPSNNVQISATEFQYEFPIER